MLTAGSNGYELSQHVEDGLRKRKAGKAGEVEQWRFAKRTLDRFMTTVYLPYPGAARRFYGH